MMKAKLPDPMRRALALAEEAAAAGEVPVGCVIVDGSGTTVGEARNRTVEWRDPTAHAELIAIRAACAALGSERIGACDLYVTLEPCAMCAAAISFARLRRVYFAAGDAKMGAVENGPRFFGQPTCHHRPEVYSSIGAAAAQALLTDFFSRRR